MTFGLTLTASLWRGEGLPILLVPISILPSQLSVIALILWTFDRRLGRRLSHAAVFACISYYAFVLPPALVADRFGYYALVSADAGCGVLAVYAFVLGAVFRESGVRLARPEMRNTLEQSPPRMQYRLLDLMKWVTLLCVALGLRATVVAQYSTAGSLIPWLGTYYTGDIPDWEFVGGICLIAGGPWLLINLVTMWIILGDTSSRRKCMVGLGLLWVAAIALLFVAMAAGESSWLFVLSLGLPLMLLPAALHAFAMRWLGWRMISPQPSTRR